MVLLLKRVTVLLLTTFITCPNMSLTMSDKCEVDLTVECALDSLKQIQNRTAQGLSVEIVKNNLNQVMNITSRVKNNAGNEKGMISVGNGVLDVIESLVSGLVRETTTNESIRIPLQSLDVEVINFGKNIFMKKTFSLSTSYASMDIELTGISNSSNASVAFISYTNMAGILNPSFNTSINTRKTMISAVVTATLLQTADTNFTSINVTFNHEFYLYGIFYCTRHLSCVHWNKTEWVEDGCRVRKSNRTHTVCSCDRQGTFAVIMQTYSVQMNTWDIFLNVVLPVGMIFLSLSALTLAFCHPNTKANNRPLINLCISLLLAMIYNLFTYNLWFYICPGKQLFFILSGIELFLFLSAAMSMLIEAVLLFIFVKSLSKVRSNQMNLLSWKWLILIAYFIPLVWAAGYTIFGCTINYVPNYVNYIYLAPFYFIYASGMILFIIIIAILIFTLIRLKNGNLQRSNTTDKKIIISIMIKTIAQFFILGGPWIFPFTPIPDKMANYIFLFFASQQGTFIFLVHCLLNQEVRKQYRKFLCAFCCSTNRHTATVDGQVAQGTA